MLVLLGTGCQLLFPFETGAPSADSATRDLGADVFALDGGGWHLVRKLAPARDGCPKPWVYAAAPAGCAVAKPICGDNAASVEFDPGIEYREVGGLVRGVQYKSTDAFASSRSSASIDQAYVDGVSITVGTPRRHVWTFASGLFAARKAKNACPCRGGAKPPAFVGRAWTCDSGNFDSYYRSVWYTAKSLWDADSEAPGCGHPARPGWFQATLPAATTRPIEVRILLDGCDENVAITALELYVR